MSEGFTAVNLPREEEAPTESLAIVSYKQEDVENNVGDADVNETSEQASTEPGPAPNSPKKRSPKNAQTNADGTSGPKTPRKKAEPKLDEAGNPIQKTPRKKAEPKLDEAGNPIQKTPRKKAEPKPKLGPNGEPLAKTPRKNAKKVKSEDKVEDDEADDMDIAGDMVGSMVGDVATAKVPGYGGEDSAALMSYYAPTPNGGNSPVAAPEEPVTPKGKKTASGGKKKRAVNEDGENDAFTTPTKKIKATASTPKSGNGKGTAIATSKDQLTEEDTMMIQYRKDGKGWPEIRKKWAEITGKPPGNSTLPNRYKRLMANITDWKDGDLERMIVAEKQVQKAFASELYGRMATVMVQLGADAYSAAAIEKAYQKEKRDGFPHAATIDQVMNGSAAPASQDDNMEDAETPDEGNSDGGVPISPGHGFGSQEAGQNGVSIKGEDAEAASDMV